MLKKLIYFIFRSIFYMILTLVILAIGGLTALYAFQNIFAVPDTTVPSVMNDDLKIAQEKINSAGLKIAVAGEEYNSQVSENRIIKQKPIPGSTIKENREVEVLLSRGMKYESVEIPNLQNKEFEEAVSLIEEYDLVLGRVTHAHHFSIQKDHVIAQVPAPGEKLLENKTINLLVSSGKY